MTESEGSIAMHDAREPGVDSPGDAQRQVDLQVGGAGSCGAGDVNIYVQGPSRDDVVVGARLPLVSHAPLSDLRTVDDGGVWLVHDEVEALAVTLHALRIGQE